MITIIIIIISKPYYCLMQLNLWKLEFIVGPEYPINVGTNEGRINVIMSLPILYIYDNLNNFFFNFLNSAFKKLLMINNKTRIYQKVLTRPLL